jgi:2-keto-4-pentenoate hydratase
MQQMVGVNEPIAGAILANTIHQSPATVCGDDFGRLGVECEIAVQLQADLPAAQAPYHRESVAAAIGAVRAAFELIDDRHADYATLAADIHSLLADNAWNAGIVLGPGVTDWHAIDLAAARGTMRINGDLVGQGEGRDVMGHPLAALAWLANTLAKRGKSLKAGMTVMTGSVVATKFVQLGDRVELSVDGLGEVSLQIT